MNEIDSTEEAPQEKEAIDVEVLLERYTKYYMVWYRTESDKDREEASQEMQEITALLKRNITR